MEIISVLMDQLIILHFKWDGGQALFKRFGSSWCDHRPQKLWQIPQTSHTQLKKPRIHLLIWTATKCPMMRISVEQISSLIWYMLFFRTCRWLYCLILFDASSNKYLTLRQLLSPETSLPPQDFLLKSWCKVCLYVRIVKNKFKCSQILWLKPQHCGSFPELQN